MVGLDRLTRHILDEARADAETIRKSAEAECFRIRVEAEKQVEERRAEFEEDIGREIAELRSRAESGAAMERRNRVIEAKHRIIDELFDKARRRVRELGDEEYLRFLVQLSDGALAALSGTCEGSYVVSLSGEDTERYGRKLIKILNVSHAGGVKLSEENAKIDGGVIVSCGGISINCSLSVIFDRLKSELELEVSRTLFGEN